MVEVPFGGGGRVCARSRWEAGRWSVTTWPPGSDLPIARWSFHSLPELIWWAKHMLGAQLELTDDLSQLWREAGIAA